MLASIHRQMAEELAVSEQQVEAAVALLTAVTGCCSSPARYRKEQPVPG